MRKGYDQEIINNLHFSYNISNFPLLRSFSLISGRFANFFWGKIIGRKKDDRGDTISLTCADLKIFSLFLVGFALG
jgi:hypothetical protein